MYTIVDLCDTGGIYMYIKIKPGCASIIFLHGIKFLNICIYKTLKHVIGLLLIPYTSSVSWRKETQQLL